MAKLIEITGKALSGEWGIDDQTGEGIPVLRTTNFTNEGVVDYKNVVTRTITKKNIEEKFLRKGDIIIEKSGGSDKFPVGRVIYFEGEDNTYLFNNFTGLLRVKNQEIWYPRYVFYSLFANYRRGGTRMFENKTTGIHNLKLAHYISQYEVNEIVKEEQISVCDKLDKLYVIINEMKQQLRLLDDLIKARFVEMFGDSASNEKGWKMNTFGDICTVRQGLQIPISKRLTEYEEDSYEYITVQYLHGGKEKEYIKSPKESVKCTKDDILMTRTGNTGMVVTNVEGVFHNNFFLIDFDRERFEKDFLVEYLNLDLIQADITRRAGTSTIPDLNHGEFYKIKVFEPPIDLQKEFDEFKMQVDKSKVAVQKALDETQTLFDSLMQEYFG